MKTNCMLWICILLFGIFFVGCTEQDEIKIGVAVSLTGIDSLFGISVRNGVEYAVEEINEAGGVNGKKIKLIVKDDMNTIERAAEVDKELLDEGVCAIIGHITSEMTKAGISHVNEKKILMISPTVSSEQIVKVNNFLISLSSSDDGFQKVIRDYILSVSDVRRISVIYDVNNFEYSNHWFETFRTVIEGTDIKIVDTVEFDSSEVHNDYYLLASKIISQNPEGVLIIAPALLTANISQQLYKIDPTIQKYTTTWAFDDALIENGGPAVASMTVTTPYDKYSEAERHLQFREGYIERYGMEPEFASAFAYEAVYILSQVIKESNSCEPEILRDKILEIGTFEGLTSAIQIDSKGMSSREVFLYIVDGNDFKKIFLDSR